MLKMPAGTLNLEGNPVEFPSVIDSTIRASFASCPAKWYWSYVRRLGSLGGSPDLIAGGAFAKGIEVTRQAFWGEKASFSDAFLAGTNAAIESYGDYVPPPHKEAKSVIRVVEALGHYFTRWPIASDPIQPYFWAEGKPAVEFSFAIPLPLMHPTTGEPLIYAGRSDLIGVYRDQLWVTDEKTTSQLGPTWGSKWNVRGQFTGYVWAARLTGLTVAGAIVRGISFLKNSFGDAESIQFRPQWMVDAWYDQLLLDVQGMIDAWERNQFSQALADPCEEYGGCLYQGLCGAENPEVWVPGKFRHNGWNPLTRTEGKQASLEQKDGGIVPMTI